MGKEGMTSYYDMVSGKAMHTFGGRERDCGFKDGIRPHVPILSGMLLQVGVRMVRLRGIGPNLGTYPDLVPTDLLHKIDDFDEDSLRKYIRGFTKTVIPLLDLDSESVEFIWDNLGRVVEHLVPKLRKGHLKFYKCGGGKKSPDDGAAIAFLDTSHPESPVFLFPVFGLKRLTGGRGYVHWSPCPESKEPEPKRFKGDKTMESLPTGDHRVAIPTGVC